MDTNFDKKIFIENFKNNCNRVQTKKFIKGETVTTYIEKRNQICIVLSGEVDLIRYDFNGNKTITVPSTGIYMADGEVSSYNIKSEKVYHIAAEFLPLATPTTAGTVKQAAAVANVTAAPTAEEFNALLKSLRDAGILATSLNGQPK